MLEIKYQINNQIYCTKCIPGRQGVVTSLSFFDKIVEITWDDGSILDYYFYQLEALYSPIVMCKTPKGNR